MALIPVDGSLFDEGDIPELIGLPEGTTISIVGDSSMIIASDSSLAGFGSTSSEVFLIVSTGIAANVTDANTGGSQGTDIGTSGVADDSITLSFSIPVPANVDSLSFSFSFLSEEFPEFVLPLAEENFIRGYQQALEDVDAGKKIYEEELAKKKDEQTD